MHFLTILSLSLEFITWLLEIIPTSFGGIIPYHSVTELPVYNEQSDLVNPDTFVPDKNFRIRLL